jgi:hypothetical protein
MDGQWLRGEWNHISQFFPSNLDWLAKATGAVTRWRKVRSGEELLRLCLAYVVEDLSLRSTAAWSSRSDWVEIKDTSVLHRLKAAVPFLQAVLAHLLNHRITPDQAPGGALRLVDATVLSIPGSVGTDWRIHAVYDPVACRLTSVQITDHTGGERLDRGGYEGGDIVVGDRGLAHAQGIHAVHAADAWTLVRMHWQNIRLHGIDGSPLELDQILARADAGDTGTEILVPLEGSVPVAARLIVRPLPADRAEQARDLMKRNAAKKGRRPSAVGLRLAGYFSVLTTIPSSAATDDAVLEFYRVRWQIELFFKRAKSLLRLGALRADDPDLVKCYCTSKLIEVALTELLASESESFSPWGVPRRRSPAPQPLAADPPAQD